MSTMSFEYRSEDPSGPRWSVMVALSVLLHVGVMGSVMFYPGSVSTRKIPGTVYEVSLVDMPASRSGPPGRQAGVAPDAAAAAAAAAPAAAPAASLAAAETSVATDPAPAKRIETPRPVEKPAVIAKRTVEAPAPAVPERRVDPAELIDRAVSIDQKKTETEKRDPTALISDAVSRIQREVDEKIKEASLIGDAIARLETRQEETEAGAGGGGRGGGAVGDSIRGRLYEMQVRDRISRNWVYPVTLESVSGDPRAVVTLQVRSNGSIVSYSIRQKSGNPRFDDSVLKAVERSDPLPPFPEGFGKQQEFILNFNLSDLRR